MHGVGARILDEAVSVTRDAGCLHMRCNVKWDSPAGIALYRKCGFALTDITDDDVHNILHRNAEAILGVAY